MPASSEAGCPVPSCPAAGPASPLKCAHRAEPDAVSSTGRSVGAGATGGPGRGALHSPQLIEAQQGAQAPEPGGRTPAGPLGVQVADLSVPRFPCEQTKHPAGSPLGTEGPSRGTQAGPQGGAQGALAMTMTRSQASRRLTNEPKVKVTATAGRKRRKAAPRSSPAAALPLWVLPLMEAQPWGRAAQGTSASPQGP